MSVHDAVPGRNAPSDDPRLNPDLARIQRELVALVHRLEFGMDDVSSPEAATALSDAIVEADAREKAVFRVLMAARTDDIETVAAQVSARIPDVERAIEDLADLQAFVSGITALLGTVDRAIGLARSAC